MAEAPSVRILSPQNGASFTVGDSIVVEAQVQNATQSELVIGSHRQTINHSTEQQRIRFSPHTLTASDVGDLKIGVASRNMQNTEAVDSIAVYIGQDLRSNFLIVLDPGHGSSDPGAIRPNIRRYGEILNHGLYNGEIVAFESVLAWELSVVAQQVLESAGYRVILTRGENDGLSLDARWQQGMEKNADAFISIHFNAADNTTASGLEVFYHPNRVNDREFATNLYNYILGALDNRGNRSQPVRGGNFAVIRHPTSGDSGFDEGRHNYPRALIEVEFMSHTEEMNRLGDNWTENKNGFARAILKAVDSTMLG